MLIGLLKSLPKEQKSNWPLHLPSLVVAYNGMPHDTTGYRPYEVMFGHKAPTMCDSWLGLANYNDNFLQSKCTWVNQQHELILAANRWALKRMKISAEKSVYLPTLLVKKPTRGLITPQNTHPYGTRSKTQVNTIMQSSSEDEAEHPSILEPSLEDTENLGVMGNLINCISTKLWW